MRVKTEKFIEEVLIDRQTYEAHCGSVELINLLNSLQVVLSPNMSESIDDNYSFPSLNFDPPIHDFIIGQYWESTESYCKYGINFCIVLKCIKYVE